VRQVQLRALLVPPLPVVLGALRLAAMSRHLATLERRELLVV